MSDTDQGWNLENKKMVLTLEKKGTVIEVDQILKTKSCYLGGINVIRMMHDVATVITGK